MTSTNYCAIAAVIVNSSSSHVLINREIRQNWHSERFIVVRREEYRWSTDKICHVTWTRRKQIVMNCNRFSRA